MSITTPRPVKASSVGRDEPPELLAGKMLLGTATDTFQHNFIYLSGAGNYSRFFPSKIFQQPRQSKSV
jgi:hypothetical protein